MLSMVFPVVNDPPEVKTAGALSNIMRKGDFSAHLSLDTVSRPGLYGLGPAAGLKGELIILDGQVYSSRWDGKELRSGVNKVSDAAMLVYSHVKKWDTIRVKAGIRDFAALQLLVEETASSRGIGPYTAFPFMMETEPQLAGFHVIAWKEGELHSMDNHRAFAMEGSYQSRRLTLLGFYSGRHHGIFTHHSTNMHIHLLEKESGTVGHLDKMVVEGELVIYLPVS